MRYLGNTHTQQFHDLEHQTPQCRVEQFRGAGHAVTFEPDTLEQALLVGYEPCFYCLGTVADLLVDLGRLVATPVEVRARDRGGGVVVVTWSHPESTDERTSFDVYATVDPTALFGNIAASVTAATEAVLAGFGDGGAVYVAVIARRRWVRSAPSPTVRVLVVPVPPSTPTVVAARTGRAPTGSGLAFSLATSPGGRLAVEDGDARIRSKLRQLLLTSPGERVNLPAYGTPLRDLVFDPLNNVLAATTEYAVAAALRQFMADLIDVQAVRVTCVDDRLEVDIAYLRRRDLTVERVRLGLPVFGGSGG